MGKLLMLDIAWVLLVSLKSVSSKLEISVYVLWFHSSQKPRTSQLLAQSCINRIRQN